MTYDDFEAAVERWLRTEPQGSSADLERLRQSAADLGASRSRDWLRIAATGIVITLAVASGFLAGAVLRIPGTSEQVGPGASTASTPDTVVTQMRKEDAAEVARAILDANREMLQDGGVAVEILSADAMSLRDALVSVGDPVAVEPASDTDINDLVWLVRADGPFVTARGLTNTGLLVGTTGYFIIEDETGLVIAMGFRK
jgi:hypothetical protein